MNRAQADRAVVAARATAAGRTGRHSAVKVLAPSTDIRTGYAGVRRHGNKVRAQGSGEQGYRSAWAHSPYTRDAVANDRRWGK